jgi:hypothetical protein
MLQETKTSLSIPASATLFLPWQGSWRVRAGRLSEPMTLQGAHLPLIAWQDGDTWGMARFTTHEDDAAWDLTLHHTPGQLNLTLSGLWKHAAPKWSSKTFPNQEALVKAIRATLPKPPRAPRASFKRQFILDIHNVKGDLVQTFDDIITFIKTLNSLRLAEDTLLYLPGWAGLYDGNYPRYQPSPAAGGDAGLAALAQCARDHAATIVPHLNHWGMSCRVSHEFPHLKPHQLIDRHGKPAGWPGIFLMDMSWPLDYIDPSQPAWIDHFSKRLSHLESLGVTGAYLDQVAPPLGDNWRKQTRAFVRAIRKRHPSLILGSESFHSDVACELDFAQLWGPVWSAMPEMPLIEPSPFLADIVAPWQQIVGHLSTPAPYPAPYVWTNYMILARMGPKRYFDHIWNFHQNSAIVPTIRLVTSPRHQRQNLKALSTLFLP